MLFLCYINTTNVKNMHLHRDTLVGIPKEIFTLEIGLQVFKSEVIVPIVFI